MQHFLEIMRFLVICCNINMKVYTLKFSESLITNMRSNCKIQDGGFNTVNENCRKIINLLRELGIKIADFKYKVKITKFRLVDSICQVKIAKKQLITANMAYKYKLA